MKRKAPIAAEKYYAIVLAILWINSILPEIRGFIRKYGNPSDGINIVFNGIFGENFS